MPLFFSVAGKVVEVIKLSKEAYMIKLIIKGGLGNQMFQYATAYSVAKKLNTDLVIDLSFMQNRLPIFDFTHREYELDLFDVNAPVTTFFKNRLMDKYASYPVEKVFMMTKLIKTFREKKSFLFDSSLFDVKDGTYIEGYFNNYKYFEAYEKEIQAIFSIDKLFNSDFSDIEEKIKSTESVSINIRRGDYVNSKNKDIYVQLNEAYYLKAINIVREHIKNPHFFVFSYDDPKWFKQALQLEEGEYTYMDRSYTGDHFKTYLRLISLCKHNIISNSTFAFWGAYLNKNPTKIVISPNRWMYKSALFEIPPLWYAVEVD
jgi:hypothetical protein